MVLMLQIFVHSTWPGTEITSCGTVGVLDVHTDIKWMPLPQPPHLYTDVANKVFTQGSDCQ